MEIQQLNNGVKMWEDLSSDEKTERMREEVKSQLNSLNRRINNLQQEINNLQKENDRLKSHSHQDNKVLIPIENDYGFGTVASSDSYPKSESYPKKECGKFYF